MIHPFAGDLPDKDRSREILEDRQRVKLWQGYLFAILATGATLALRVALEAQLGGQSTMVIFTVPIMLSAYVGGFRVGLLATILSISGASYFLLPPLGSFWIASGPERWNLFFVTIAGVVISALNEALHRARRGAQIAMREHQEAEVALLQARVLQNAIFSSATFSCIATDAKGVIQIFNVGAQRMLGYTAAEVVNKITPVDFHDPEEGMAHAAALSIEFATTVAPGLDTLVFKASRGVEDISELTNVRKDGSRFPAVVSVTALRDAGNAIIGYLLIGTDNTARKQAEEDLYVEDNPANLQLVEEIIAEFPDFRLLTAVNGTLGIERARASQPQVILMDINLPGISGVKALKILRDDPVTSHIPVIALSANAMPRDIEKGLEAGFFRYLTKPIKIEELMETLNKALEFGEIRLSQQNRGEQNL